jgi:hypothetical protein
MNADQIKEEADQDNKRYSNISRKGISALTETFYAFSDSRHPR